MRRDTVSRDAVSRDAVNRGDLSFDLFADLQEVTAGVTQGVTEEVTEEIAEEASSNASAIGLGHARRILVLGQSLHKAGVRLRCFFKNPTLARNLFASSLAGEASIPFLDWQELHEQRGEDGIIRDMLIMDSYRVTSLPTWLKSRYRHIACFHDDKAPPPFATIGICPSALESPPREQPQPAREPPPREQPQPTREPCSSAPILLRGGVYFPFDQSLLKRGEIKNAKDRTASSEHRVLVWFGGDENGTRILPIITELLRDSRLCDFSFDVIISPIVTPPMVTPASSPTSPANPTSSASSTSSTRLRLHRDITSMPHLLSRCSIYLGGAGVASCEAALLGLRLIVCALTPNQSGAASAFSRAGASLFDINFPSSVARALIDIRGSPQRVLDFRHLSFDAFGALRLSNALCDISTPGD